VSEEFAGWGVAAPSSGKLARANHVSTARLEMLSGTRLVFLVLPPRTESLNA
jgi:hypothetical protein